MTIPGKNNTTFKLVIDKNFVLNTKPVNKEIYLTCECGCAVLKVTEDKEDGEYYFTIYQYDADRYSFWERIKILFRGKTKTASVILSKENFEELKTL